MRYFFEDEIEQNEQRNDDSSNEIVEYSRADICMEDVQDESGEEEFFTDEEDEYAKEFLTNEDE